jgi:hypothetical protein
MQQRAAVGSEPLPRDGATEFGKVNGIPAMEVHMKKRPHASGIVCDGSARAHIACCAKKGPTQPVYMAP